MADGTHIEWTDATWQPITGCSVVSPGCTNCYAMKLAGTRLKHHPSRAGLTQGSKAGPVWTGEVRFNEQWLDQPIKWSKPRRIFVCAHGDLFAEGVPDEWIDRVFAVMALARQHTFQILTKRAARMRDYLRRLDVAGRWAIAGHRMGHPLPTAEIAVGWQRNGLPQVWLGVSVEDQARADERIPLLLDTPAAVRFISAEPLLGPLALAIYLDGPRLYRRLEEIMGGEHMEHPDPATQQRLDWIIVGGESGPGARPMHPDWARSLRDQCQAAGVAFHFKQWGEWTPGENIKSDRRYPAKVYFDGRWDDCAVTEADDGPILYRVGKRASGRLLDGREWSEFPSASAEPFAHDEAAHAGKADG